MLVQYLYLVRYDYDMNIEQFVFTVFSAHIRTLLVNVSIFENADNQFYTAVITSSEIHLFIQAIKMQVREEGSLLCRSSTFFNQILPNISL